MTRSLFATSSRFAPLTNVMSTFVKAWKVAKERRELRNLSQHTLNDIGLSRDDAHYEATRPFWDLPGGR